MESALIPGGKVASTKASSQDALQLALRKRWTASEKNNTIGIEGITSTSIPHHPGRAASRNGAILTTFDPADLAGRKDRRPAGRDPRLRVTDVKNVTCAEPEVVPTSAGETHIVLMHYGQAQHRAVPGRRPQGHGHARLCHGRGSGRPEPGRHHVVQRLRRLAEPVEVIENLKPTSLR